MNLLRLGCFVLLLSLSATSSARMEDYYSQAIDIDYAISGEDESMRVTLGRVIQKFLGLIAKDKEGMGFSLTPEDYFGQENADEEIFSFN